MGKRAIHIPWFGVATAILWAAVSGTAGKSHAQQVQEELPAGPGLETFRAICGECHEAAVATGMRLSRDEWKGVVQSMIERGAMISAEESSEIVEYLSSRFGTTLNINQATVQDIERFFPTGRNDAAAIVRFRDANGAFKNWDDLARVPDIDLKGMEGKKASVTF